MEMTDPPLTPATGGRSIGLNALEKGDIIVSTTSGLVSAAIRAATNGPVSHVMAFVGGDRVVEAVRENVREITLSDALNDTTLAVTFRHASITSDGVNTLTANIQSAVGNRYNYWGVILNLLAEHIGSIRRVPIPTDSFYCSQLVLTSFASAGFPLLDQGDVNEWPTAIVPVEGFGGSLLKYVGHLVAK